MKINIRKGVFETNSSSTHSLCIKNKEVVLNDIPKGTNIYLEQGEFGWERETYKNYKDKLNYIYTYIKSCFYEPTEEQQKEIDENIKYLKSIILELCPNITIEESDCDGYIDHGYELQELWKI